MDALINIISSDNLGLIIQIIIIYMIIIWVSVIIWTIKDVTHRSGNVIIQTLSVLSVLLFPVFGVFIYLLIRPQQTMFERYYEQELKEKFEQYLAENDPEHRGPIQIMKEFYEKLRKKK